MPRKTMTCPRAYRDGGGTLCRCDGPMTLNASSGTWVCSWCGCMLPARYPPR